MVLKTRGGYATAKNLGADPKKNIFDIAGSQFADGCDWICPFGDLWPTMVRCFQSAYASSSILNMFIWAFPCQALFFANSLILAFHT